MLHYHGWLIIRAAPHDTETEDADLRTAVELLEGVLDAEEGAPGLRDVRWVNGSPQYHFGGFRNRPDGVYHNALESVRQLIERAPGTYGLIYLRDDEHPTQSNEFRVLVVSRGQITEKSDVYLSPVVPKVEDPYVFDDEP